MICFILRQFLVIDKINHNCNKKRRFVSNMERSTRYYSDELNDEFSGVVRNTIDIDQNFVYSPKNFLWHMAAFVLYRLIATPLAWAFMKLYFGFKIVNRKVLKNAKGKPFFLYANHTQIPADGFMPTIIAFPRGCSVVVNADNVSLPGTQNVMKMLGAFPLPNKLAGMRNFMAHMEKCVGNKKCIVIYPEAHIWPYFTGIRNFKADSFRFPCSYGAGTYCFTVTYRKRRFTSIPGITAYVDGPFFPDESLSKKEAVQNLRDRVYQTMLERSKNSNYEYIRYVHVQ